MRKKTLTVLLLSLALCLAGCSGKSKDSDNDANPTKEVTSEAGSNDNTTPEATGDPEVTKDPEPTKTPEGEDPGLSGIFDKEVINQTYNASPVTFVVKGVQYTSPSDYLVMYSDDIGPIVYITNVFQMKMARKDSTFDEVLKGLAELDDKAIDGGAKSLVEPATKKIGDKTFAYFVVDISGEKTLGVITDSPDGKFSIAGQIVIQSENVSYDDILNMYAGIAATAKVTDKPDSTKEEIEAQIKYITGDKRKVSTLKYNSASITYHVPEGFFYTGDADGATSGSQFYSSVDTDVYVSIEDKAFPEDTAEYSIDASVKYEENAVKLVEEVNGNKVYICTSHYTGDSGKEFYTLLAKYDIDDAYTYCVTADRVDKGDISFDLIRKFFEFGE